MLRAPARCLKRAVLWAHLRCRRGPFPDDEVLEQHAERLGLDRVRVNKEVIGGRTPPRHRSGRPPAPPRGTARTSPRGARPASSMVGTRWRAEWIVQPRDRTNDAFPSPGGGARTRWSDPR